MINTIGSPVDGIEIVMSDRQKPLNYIVKNFDLRVKQVYVVYGYIRL